MTQPVGVVSRYKAMRLVREDLSDVIELVANEDTPFTANIGRAKASQTYTEWNTDALASANQDNFMIEGDDVALDARPVTGRVGNYTQIMKKVPGVTGTLQAINVVGGQKQLARELMKSGRELKLDREARFVGVKPAVAGSDSVARQAAGFGAWIRTNTVRGSGGANPTMSGDGTYANNYEGFPNAGPTDAIAANRVTFAESQLKTVMQSAWSQGGKPKIMMVNGSLKVKASTFPGIVVNRYEVGGDLTAKIIGTADVYQSDFGKLSIVPNAFMRTLGTTPDFAGEAWFIDPENVAMVTLRPVGTDELAKTGDSEKRLMIWEGTLKVNNEKAHGAIADAKVT